jgi:hypothetical protein
VEVHRLWIFEAPTFSRQSANSYRWGCQPYAPERLLIIIYVTDWVDPMAIVRLEGLGKLKKSSDLIWNRTRDLPACSRVPHPTIIRCARCLQGNWQFSTKQDTLCSYGTERFIAMFTKPLYVILDNLLAVKFLVGFQQCRLQTQWDSKVMKLDGTGWSTLRRNRKR